MTRRRQILRRGSNRVLRRRPFNPNSKCTPRRRKIILIALNAGLSQQRAAELAGIPVKTHHLWLRLGRQRTNQTYYHYYIRVKAILAREEKAALDVIKEAMRGGKKIKERKTVIGPKGYEVTRITKKLIPSWQAAAWRLERMDPNNYGRRLPFEESNPDNTSSTKQKTPDQIAYQIKAAVDTLFGTVPQYNGNGDLMPDDMPT